MEHRHTGSAGKQSAATHRAASSLLDKRNNAIGKLTRKQVSDCIHIWAAVYHLRDEDADADSTQLRLPSDSWSPLSSPCNDTGN